MRQFRLVIALCVLVVVGCNNEPGPTSDGGQDVSRDYLLDGADAINDGSGDVVADADGLVDSMPDGPEGDLQTLPDFWPLPVYTVVFAHGSSTSSMALASIKTDGTDYKLLPGFGSLKLSVPTKLVGTVEEYYTFSRDIPQEERKYASGPLYLPRGLGYLQWYAYPAVNEVGLLLHRRNGEIKSLYTTSGTTIDQLRHEFAVTLDGVVVAGIRNNVGIVMVRTNGTKFANGQTFVEFDPITAGNQLYSASLTFVGDNLFFVTRQSSAVDSKHTLWRVPIDGSQEPTAVTLPKVGDEDPLWIGEEIAGAILGSIAVTIAGAYESDKRDVIAIDSAGVAINLTNLPSNYAGRGYTWGANDGTQLAVSPLGKLVAYVKNTEGVEDLFIAKTDGTIAPVLVTNSSNVSAVLRRIHNLRFLDEDILLLTAGMVPTKFDVFRYIVSKEELYNLTGYGSTTKPYDLSSGITTWGMWLSPNKRFFFLLGGESKSGNPPVDITAVDLQTWKTKQVTSGAEVYRSVDGIGTCPNSATMLFGAEPIAEHLTKHEIYSFDMDSASKAIPLSKFSKELFNTLFVREITFSSNCDYAAFVGGDAGRFDLYAGKISAPGTLNNITDLAWSIPEHYVSDDMLISPDNMAVVFLSGPAIGSHEMKVAPLNSSRAAQTILSSNYWILFGIK
ncbi:MAG: hypothetical protein V1754_07935 [Pseudomonadota bacterium]